MDNFWTSFIFAGLREISLLSIAAILFCLSGSSFIYSWKMFLFGIRKILSEKRNLNQRQFVSSVFFLVCKCACIITAGCLLGKLFVMYTFPILLQASH